MNKFAIRYTENGKDTSHSFDTMKELNMILSHLTPETVVQPMKEGMPKNMFLRCMEHNDTAILLRTL